MSTLETAIKIAIDAHKGQVDKAGKPYILHPLRVMFSMDTDTEQIVAVLHDVVEDTDWTFGRLREVGFPEDVLDAIYSVTRQAGESYMEFIRRAGQNKVGRKVKMADLKDNLDLSRIKEPTEKDHKRMARYRTALEILESCSRPK
jgi:(p)ppGpp synthase/HD superfamily hydrolase